VVVRYMVIALERVIQKAFGWTGSAIEESVGIFMVSRPLGKTGSA